MPTYNQMRKAFGLSPVKSFAEITGESSDSFPTDPELSVPAVDDPDSLDFLSLTDSAGNPLPADSEEATSGTRRTPLAARLKAIYGSVAKVEAFVGMVSEPHLPGAEFGELQMAIWKQQFEALRDGDRFFYANDPVLREIKDRYGVTYRYDLGDLIALNTEVERGTLPDNVFVTGG